MFQLVELHDKALVKAAEFGREHSAIELWLNVKYSGKVIPGKGICLCVYDLVHVGDGALFPGHADAYYSVRFRMILFSPRIGDLVTGRVVRSSPEGVFISIGCFDGIVIPAAVLQSAVCMPCTYSTTREEWYWQYQEHCLYITPASSIRFRVIGTQLEESKVEVQEPPSGEEEPSSAEIVPKRPLYWVFGAMDEDGLGLMSWWT